ncbi:hypothetical protein [Paracoccus sp. MC1862]|uniref:hypothetical protein n=1 Tax=Paracoccus sp. MC1862 TaxID=2760307 RepID=UPI001600FBA3|nr:hypothetical protein [Paracoccus sp. MC1862]MBB1498936.1 hypothetical protein [Paracoccus sp. MC1862]QQO46732.1 hypothetical protein JGR78_17255 [Paracoccus sp. MC1862]
MLKVELIEGRSQISAQNGSDHVCLEDVPLGAFRLAALPAAGDKLTITAYGAPNHGDGFSANVYSVIEVWHDARHVDVTGGIVTDHWEASKEPSIKVFVSFCHSRKGRHISKINHPVRKQVDDLRRRASQSASM